MPRKRLRNIGLSNKNKMFSAVLAKCLLLRKQEQFCLQNDHNAFTNSARSFGYHCSVKVTLQAKL